MPLVNEKREFTENIRRARKQIIGVLKSKLQR